MSSGHVPFASDQKEDKGHDHQWNIGFTELVSWAMPNVSGSTLARYRLLHPASISVLMVTHIAGNLVKGYALRASWTMASDLQGATNTW